MFKFSALTVVLQYSWRFCSILLYYLMHFLQVRCVEVFKGFYETRTKHRKLTWIYSLGTCNINGKFDSKPIELIVSTYQVIVFAKPCCLILGLELGYWIADMWIVLCICWLFYRLPPCCYSIILIDWAIQKLWLSWTWPMMMWLDCSILCPVPSIRSWLRSQTQGLSRQQTTLSSIPSSRTEWGGLRYSAISVSHHLIYSLIFPTAFLVPPSPQLGNSFLFYLFIYCFLCIRNDKLLKIFQL